jgi:hypothetical protein
VLSRLRRVKHYTNDHLADLEGVHQILDMYLWLSMRLPLVFAPHATAEAYVPHAAMYLMLQALGLQPIVPNP